MSTCPLCLISCDVHVTGREDAVIYLCPDCGSYDASNRLDNLLRENPIPSADLKVVRTWLHQQRQKGKDVPSLRTDVLEKILRRKYP